jgi:hypothetical protein
MSSCPRLFPIIAAILSLSLRITVAESAPAPPIGYPSPARPISELPPHVKFIEGEKSVFIDYAAAKDGMVPAYIVNGRPSTPLHGRWITFLTRETQAKDGTWYRCDHPKNFPPHFGADPADKAPVPPGFFYQTTCRLHSPRGEKRKVRFVVAYPSGDRTYPSNEGFAIVDPDEAMAGLREGVALGHFGAFHEYAAVALGTIPVSKEHSDVRLLAVDLIGRNTDDPRRVPLLKRVLAQAKQHGDLELYRYVMRALSMPDSMDEKEAIALAALASDTCRARAVAIWAALRSENPNRAQQRWSGQAFWTLLSTELKSRNSARAGVAMQNIARAEVPLAQKLALLEKMISNPRHPILVEAINVYTFIGQPSAIPAVTETLRAVAESSAHSKAVRTVAREALAKISGPSRD